jgi:hypothetical protein
MGPTTLKGTNGITIEEHDSGPFKLRVCDK